MGLWENIKFTVEQEWKSEMDGQWGNDHDGAQGTSFRVWESIEMM
jgi:hypothetical protein